MKMITFRIANTAKSLVMVCAVLLLLSLADISWAQDGKPLGRPELVLQSASSRIFCVAWSPDGKTLATGIGFGAIRLWDAQSGALLRAPQ